MIFWIILAIVTLITGVTAIAFSGDSEEEPEEVPEEEPEEVPEPLPTASLALTGASPIAPGPNGWTTTAPDYRIGQSGIWNPPIVEGRVLWTWGDPVTVTLTPTFTGGTAILSASFTSPSSGYPGTPAIITPTPGTLTLTTGTPYIFAVEPLYGYINLIVTFTLTVTSPSGQIVTTSESFGIVTEQF
jgi:hypothetical protein